MDTVNFVYLKGNQLRLYRYYPETYVVKRKYAILQEKSFKELVLYHGWDVALDWIRGRELLDLLDSREEAKVIYDRFRVSAIKAGFEYLHDDPQSIDIWMGRD